MAISIVDTDDGSVTYTDENGDAHKLSWEDVDLLYGRKPSMDTAADDTGE